MQQMQKAAKSKNPKFAVNDTFTVNEDSLFVGALLANDTAPPNNTISVYSIS